MDFHMTTVEGGSGKTPQGGGGDRTRATTKKKRWRKKKKRKDKVCKDVAANDARILKEREETGETPVTKLLSDALLIPSTQIFLYFLRHIEALITKQDIVVWEFVESAIDQMKWLTNREKKLLPALVAAATKAIPGTRGGPPEKFVLSTLAKYRNQKNQDITPSLVIQLFKFSPKPLSSLLRKNLIDEIDVWFQSKREDVAVEAFQYLNLRVYATTEEGEGDGNDKDFALCMKLANALVRCPELALAVAGILKKAALSPSVKKHFGLEIVRQLWKCPQRDTKKMVKVAKTFSISFGEIPHVVRECEMSAMRWLIASRQMGMIQVLLREGKVDKRTISSAWRRKHKSELADEIDKYERRQANLHSESAFYRLPSTLPIRDVADETSLRRAIHVIVRAPLVGFDAEWRPSLSVCDEKPKTSLLQISTESVAFLVDILAFRKTPALRSTLHDALRQIFTCPALKISFDGRNDVQMLLATLSDDGESGGRERRHSGSFSWLAFDYDLKLSQAKRGSLSDLVSHYLGKPLNKDVRMSDWNRRPLTPAQRHYAAADAYTLVAIHRKIHSQAPRCRSGKMVVRPDDENAVTGS